MDDKIVCKVMWYSYKGLEDRCELLDKDIRNTAIRSAFKNTMEVVGEIERLTAEKIAYINVKVIIDEALRSLNRRYEIVQHDIKGKTLEQITTELNAKKNTIDSRLTRQRVKLYEAILERYSGEELLNIICDSPWLMNKYRKELKQTAQNEPKTGDR